MPKKKQDSTGESDQSKARPTADVGTIARLFGLTAVRIQQLAKDGIIFKAGHGKYDLWRSIKGYIEFLQKNKYAASGNSEKSGKTDAGSVELEGLIEQVKAARTYNDARTLKLQIEALRSGYALEIDQGKHVERPIIEEALIRIGSAVKAAIMRMEADLPPMLEGMEPAAMQRTIRGKVDEVMATLADESSKVWEVETDG